MLEITRFHQWYARAGHWLYHTKEKAAIKWLQSGIECLEDAPEYVTLTMILNGGNDDH